jgi:two-component system, OmpR family, sensor histidine kinase VicK
MWSDITNVHSTEVLHGAENAVGRGIRFMKNVQNKMDICFDHRAPSIVIEVPAYRNGYSDIRNRGGKIRCFTEITKNNLRYCKELLTFVDELRHLEGMKGGIAVSETEYMATTVLEEAKPLTEVIYSNVKEVVEQGQYIFDILWSSAIPAENRIREIEEGLEPEIIETIRDTKEVQNVAYELVNSARKQILVIFSTANAFHRQERAGIIQMLRDAASRGVDVRVLTPMDEEIKSIAEREKKESFQLRKEELQHQQKMLDIRDIETSSLRTKISLLIVDGSFSLAAELKDDTKDSSHEAIGIATYSNSKPTVQSYVAFFESLWMLAESYRLMKIHDKMQTEFVNIAAHELRTPIQPIIGLADMLQKEGERYDVVTQKEFLDVIIRNARRLYKLSEDILDVARIESQTLILNKQKINLKELLSGIVRDFVSYKVQQPFKPSFSDIKTDSHGQVGDNKIRQFLPLSSPTLTLLFECKETEDIYVVADSARLTQAMCNVLANAIEFSSKQKGGGEGRGIISVILNKKNDDDYDSHALISIQDNGPGIDAEIFPRLFSKFATKSEKGTGLGLFISRNIIEAHDGKIWAKNNPDGKGATFQFTLPIRDNEVKPLSKTSRNQ